MNKPDFIDNRNGNTLARALGEALGMSGGQTSDPSESPRELRVATGYFSPSGFARIADHLQPIPLVRLMVGTDLAAESLDQRRHLGETQDRFERRRLQVVLQRMNDVLKEERDRLPFTRTSAAAINRLIAALRSGNMEVRRYERSFLHAKAYIFSSDNGDQAESDGVIVGSSNLTGAGLTSNLELNIGRYDPSIVGRSRQWFDELWEEAEPYDLVLVFEEAARPRKPFEIFIRVLWQLYGSEVAEEGREDEILPLTSFQKHGVARTLRLIREIGGAIVADEVGLGKTFIAGEVLQIYHERRQRALLICPAALRDTTWKKFLTKYQLFVECLSFEELASDIQLKDAQRPLANQQKLQRPIEEYQLVVVDEAHNYRNPDAPTRAGALRHLLFGPKRDLLLLTATPVNNSLWDLYHLVRFFVRQDAHFADRGILSIRERFDRAMREDPSSLSPDLLFPIIDATTVKRTRQFVKKHYSGDRIPGPDGRPIPIVFPEPRAVSIRYSLEDMLPEFFDKIEAALDPDSDEAIVFSRYMASAYLLDDEDAENGARSLAMVGLLRSGLLKRFESSAYAFRETAGKMLREHEAFLEALELGYVVSTEFMRELSADDESAFEDLLEGSEHQRDAALYDIESLRNDVVLDRDQLRVLVDEARKITPGTDPKLKALTDELVEIAREAAENAITSIDEGQKRKVLVFSFFEDTVEWIKAFLDEELRGNSDLSAYCGRLAVVSGSGNLAEVSRQNAVQGFAPISMEAPPGQDADLYDLLITTDVLAEGVNLQQCRHIINFDVPWNPMRLVQRHGRIDRIGSPHTRVFLRTVFPVDRLNQLLNLEQRILDKLAMAAASVGVVAPIEGAAQGSQVFTETRKEIEKLLKEDASLFERGGTEGAAQTGEEYRQTLRKYLSQHGQEVAQLPWKIGSGMRRGERRGVFFCAVVGSRTYLRFVSADETWKVSTADDSIVDEVGACLRLIECVSETPEWYPNWLQEQVYDFWEVAQQNILTHWTWETDPANLQPRVRPLNLRVAEFIRENYPVGEPQEKVHRALDILESPWPRREEIMLRAWFDSHKERGADGAASLVEEVLITGIEAVVLPEPLPPIELEDIELLCWMGIEAEDGGLSEQRH